MPSRQNDSFLFHLQYMHLPSSETERYEMANGSHPLALCLQKLCRSFDHSYRIVLGSINDSATCRKLLLDTFFIIFFWTLAEVERRLFISTSRAHVIYWHHTQWVFGSILVWLFSEDYFTLLIRFLYSRNHFSLFSLSLFAVTSLMSLLAVVVTLDVLSACTLKLHDWLDNTEIIIVPYCQGFSIVQNLSERGPTQVSAKGSLMQSKQTLSSFCSRYATTSTHLRLLFQTKILSIRINFSHVAQRNNNCQLTFSGTPFLSFTPVCEQFL